MQLFDRDMRSFQILFEFESDVQIRFDSKVTDRFENFESPRLPRLPSYHKQHSLSRSTPKITCVETLVADMFCPLQRPVDNTTGDKLGVWRDMRLADALVPLLVTSTCCLYNDMECRLSRCSSAACVSQARQRFTILEVAADWHEIMTSYQARSQTDDYSGGMILISDFEPSAILHINTGHLTKHEHSSSNTTHLNEITSLRTVNCLQTNIRFVQHNSKRHDTTNHIQQSETDSYLKDNIIRTFMHCIQSLPQLLNICVCLHQLLF